MAGVGLLELDDGIPEWALPQDAPAMAKSSRQVVPAFGFGRRGSAKKRRSQRRRWRLAASQRTAGALGPSADSPCQPIDPKREIKEVAVELAGGDLRVFEPCEGRGVRQVVIVMASPEWSVQAARACGWPEAGASEDGKEGEMDARETQP